MFIVSLTYKAPLSEVDLCIEAHMLYLEKFYDSGTFIASGRKIPRTGGVILINADNRAQVEQVIQQDPFYIADVADYEITQFVPTMTMSGLEKLKEFS